jgi:hypothetical protein
VIAATPVCHVAPNVLRGDVDGDGRADRVSLDGKRCTLLVVRARGRTYSVRLRSDMLGPEVEKLAPLDARRGDEIVVAVDHGACSDWLHVFTFRRGRLVQMRIPGDGYFYYIQCGSGFGGLDCLARGTVFAWGMIPHGRPQRRTTIRIYRARRTRFVFVGQRVIRIRYRANGATLFPGGLFDHCR